MDQVLDKHKFPKLTLEKRGNLTPLKKRILSFKPLSLNGFISKFFHLGKKHQTYINESIH